MKPLGQMLSAAGIDFTDARAKHTPDGLKEVEIVVVDEANRVKCEALNLGAVVRVATPEELERHRQLMEML